MKTTSKKEYWNIKNNIYVATNILMHLELIKMKLKAYLQTERVDALARKLVAQR